MSRIYRHIEESEIEKAKKFSKVIKLPWHLYKEENIMNFEKIYKRKFTENDKITANIHESKDIKLNASGK